MVINIFVYFSSKATSSVSFVLDSHTSNQFSLSTSSSTVHPPYPIELRKKKQKKKTKGDEIDEPLMRSLYLLQENTKKLKF